MFYSKNKFEKLVHVVGFIIRIYHDARSVEHQICVKLTVKYEIYLNWHLYMQQQGDWFSEFCFIQWTCICTAIILQSFVIGVSTTSHINWNNINWISLFHKHSVKDGVLVPIYCILTKENIYSYLLKIVKKKWNVSNKLQFQRGHFLSSCRQVIWIILSTVQQYMWRMSL